MAIHPVQHFQDFLPPNHRSLHASITDFNTIFGLIEYLNNKSNIEEKPRDILGGKS